MSRKKPKLSDEEDRDLINHFQGLGLETVDDYRDWCARNGFSTRLKKHWNDRCRERFHARGARARERLQHKKREQRNPLKVLAALCEGRLREDDVTQPHLQRLLRALDDDASAGPRIDRPALLRLIAHLHRCRAKLFDGVPVIANYGEQPGNTYLEALALIAAAARDWLRPVESWKPRTHNAFRQFASLLRHLFVKYDGMPGFFDAVWFAGRTPEAAAQRSWYLHVGRGENIRQCALPIHYTKKMAHHFMRAPASLTVEQALRWGQVHGLGGDERLAQTIFGTRLTDDFTHDEFWTSVIRWLIQHPMLDRDQVGPIVDYLHNQRFVPERVFAGPAGREALRPPQPNLTMKGRSPESLLRQVTAWHRVLGRDNTQQVQQWKSSGIGGFEFLEGSEARGTLKCWTIRELLSSKALFVEGRRMRHCVATYASSCAGGNCSIWTMEVESLEGRRKAVTIEVSSGRMICQVRGRSNRRPTEKERDILRRWAAQEKLSTPSYLK